MLRNPARFKSSKGVGAHFGLTPKKYQSGETDITGRISKIGDEGVRTALYEAGHIILTQPLKGCTALKSWAMRLAKRAGARPQARRDHASHAGRWNAVRFCRCGGLTGRVQRISGSTGHRLPEAEFLAGTTDQTRARLVGLSSTDTIRWRPRADPVQKQVLGDRITQERD